MPVNILKISFTISSSKADALLKYQPGKDDRMKKTKQIQKTAKTALSLALAGALGLSCLVGCTGSKKQPDVKPPTGQTQQVAPDSNQKNSGGAKINDANKADGSKTGSGQSATDGKNATGSKTVTGGKTSTGSKSSADSKKP